MSNKIIKNKTEKPCLTSKCENCGKCCIGRSVLLSPKDIYNLSKKFNLSPGEFFEKYCEATLYPETELPIVVLKQTGENRKCIFSESNGCKIKNDKPVECKLYPFHRQVAFRYYKDTEKIGLYLNYIPLETYCKYAKELHDKVDMVEASGILTDKKYYLEWDATCGCLWETLQYLKDTNACKEDLNRYYNFIKIGAYLCYDINKPFQPQFEERMQMMRGYSQGVMEGYYDFDRAMKEPKLIRKEIKK